MVQRYELFIPYRQHCKYRGKVQEELALIRQIVG